MIDSTCTCKPVSAIQAVPLAELWIITMTLTDKYLNHSIMSCILQLQLQLTLDLQQFDASHLMLFVLMSENARGA